MSRVMHLPHIDGLRAVAVTAVMVFHLDRAWLPGGFLGVDVFFVISGYLITGILVAEASSGSLSILSFFQRRIARILPLSLFVILAVLCAASPFFTAVDMSTAGAAATSAALSVANLKFMAQGDYFQVLPDAQPLLHYWSLSIEEQFYLILPFMVLWGVCRGRLQRRFAITLATLLTLSLTACVLLTPINRTYAFYLLPTRAWELLAGGLLAVLRPPTAERPNDRPLRWHWFSGWLGIVVVAACLANMSEGTGFPGYIALAPVAGTLLLIMSCDASTGIRSLLSRSELQAIGRVSYSLYLWHWPVYCIVDYALRESSAPTRTVLKVLLTAVLSIASYSAIERPARRWLGDPARRRHAFVLAGVAIAAVALAGIAVRRGTFVTAPISDLPAGGTVFNGGQGKMKVVLIGDSKAGVFSESLIELSHELDFQLNVLAFSSINPIPPGEKFSQIKQQVDRLRPDVAIFCAAWSTHEIRIPLEEVGSRVVGELAGSAGTIILVGEPPLLPTADYRSLMRSTGRSQVPELEADRLRRRVANDALAGCRSARVWYLDPDAFVTDADGLIRLEDPSGGLIFQDRIHLSMKGAALLSATFRDLLNQARAESFLPR